MIYYRKTLFGSGPKLTAVQTDRVVEAIDHNKPNELMAAMMIACQALGQTNLTIYNAMAEQHHQCVDSYFQMIDKGRQQVYEDASQI